MLLYQAVSASSKTRAVYVIVLFIALLFAVPG